MGGGTGGVRSKLERPAVARHRLFIPPESQQRVSQVIVRLGQIRPKLEHTAVVVYRVLELSQIYERIAQIAMRLRVIWPQLERPEVARNRLAPSIRSLPGHPETVVRFGEIGFEADTFVQPRDPIPNIPLTVDDLPHA